MAFDGGDDDDGEWTDERPEPQIKALEPKPFKRKPTKKRICTFDTETDPFAVGRVVKPFSVGFYDGECYIDFWGDDCVDQFFAHLAENYEPGELLIYAHNFGRFDAYFQLDYLDVNQNPFIMGGAIVSALFQGQEFRDSWRIIPAPLRAYKKDDIDYSKLEREVRETHKREILEYQKSDCVYLHELVTAFHERYGDRLTIGSTSLPMLNSFHGFRLMGEEMDALIRPYYYGGRTQCFKTGLFRGKFFIYDVNSMYPHAMRNMEHPIGNIYTLGRYITDWTAFVHVDGWSNGAFPVRGEDGSLSFPVGRGKFKVSIYEYEAALETGAFTLERVISVRDCSEWTTFDKFVDFYYAEKSDGKLTGDQIKELFSKFFLNSPYGKFAQNPEKYETFELRHNEDPPPLEDMRILCIDPECERRNHKQKGCTNKGWYPHTTNGEVTMWAKASSHGWRSYKNVGTAASITGGARAELLRGIRQATEPMYCDTDSLICEGFSGEVSSSKLGAWDLEAQGDVVAIAGKKMYCVLSYDLSFNPKKGTPEFVQFEGRKMRVVKKASKGVRLSAQEIIRLCQGEIVLYENPVPKFDLNGGATFITRRVRRTGNA